MANESGKSSRASYLLISPTWLVIGGFFLLPLVIMLVISFGQRGTYGGLKPIEDLAQYILSGAFLGNYRQTFDALYLGIYWRSLWMAVLTTVFCLVISYPIAYYIAIIAPARWKNLLLALVVIPFWTSFLIRTYAWMLILRTEGLLNTVLLQSGLIQAPLDLLYNEFAVMIGLVYGELPFMILPLYASLEKLDLTLLEASSDLGRQPRVDLLARHGAADHAGHRGRHRAGVHPQHRPVRGVGPAGRRQEHAGRQPHPEPVRDRPQQAVRLRRGVRADGGGAGPAAGLCLVHEEEGA
jgi:ABC-type spermidine/putrescine transport system permease subunit I